MKTRDDDARPKARDERGAGLYLPQLPADRVRHGDGWTMIHAPCNEVLHRIGRFATMITDPPYSPHVHGALGKEGRNDGRASRDALEFGALTRPLARAVARAAAYLCDRWALFFCDEWTLETWRREGIDAGLRWARHGVWVKPDAMPQMSGDGPSTGIESLAILKAAHATGEGRSHWNGGGHPAVYTYPSENFARTGSIKLHDTPKPVPLCAELVRLYSDRGEVVVDPFAGAAPVGVACIREGRRYVGIEMRKASFDIAVERLIAEQAHTTIKAARSGQAPLFGGA